MFRKALGAYINFIADWNRFSKISEIPQYDMNKDGSNDISEVLFLVNAILTSSAMYIYYDVNDDRKVVISDVMALVNHNSWSLKIAYITNDNPKCLCVTWDFF